jgi:DNA-binding Lrp family transcriptional regulator
MPKLPKKAAVNWILSKLRQAPATTVREQADYLEVEETTVKAYHRLLVQQGRAFHATILPSRKTPEEYQRFWIFIETTYQHEHAERIKRELQEAHSLEADESMYQEWVADSINRKLMDRFSDLLVSVGIDVILGSEYDLVLTLDAKSPEAVHTFVTRHVRTCPCVLRTSTAWAKTVMIMPVKQQSLADEVKTSKISSI